MLTLYRRHLKGCPHQDRFYRRCQCPMWIEGVHEGKYRRESLKISSWTRAEQIKQEILVGDPKAEPETKQITIREALQKFIADCESRALTENTLQKYQLLDKTLRHYADGRGFQFLQDLDMDAVRVFRGGWKLSPRTQSKTLERLRAFFRFCQENEWIAKNPAAHIKAPIVRNAPVLPFSEAQVEKILACAQSWRTGRNRWQKGGIERGERTTLEPRTLVFIKVLLFTGLRILDAAKLTKDRVQNGRIFLYTTKTGVAVSLLLPDDLNAELQAIPHYQIFQTPTGTERDLSVAEYWRVQMGKVFAAAGIKGHPHQFRHTMARRLLEQGASPDDVAAILGNSPDIVRKHYAPWIQSRQDALDERLKALWQKPKLVRVK